MLAFSFLHVSSANRGFQDLSHVPVKEKRLRQSEKKLCSRLRIRLKVFDFPIAVRYRLALWVNSNAAEIPLSISTGFPTIRDFRKGSSMRVLAPVPTMVEDGGLRDT
jgi:hypothetical protein